jgi:hypothetical protein
MTIPILLHEQTQEKSMLGGPGTEIAPDETGEYQKFKCLFACLPHRDNGRQPLPGSLRILPQGHIALTAMMKCDWVRKGR